MPPDDDSPQKSFADILPKQPEPRAVPVKTFKAWHRPRKQYVRQFQWAKQIRNLIGMLHFSEDPKIFRYLSLPGNDLLDVRSIREACFSTGVVLKYVGLNFVDPESTDEIQLNLARNDVNSLAGIHTQSTILLEKFEAIAEKKSLAFAHVESAGPYHCINVDLCNSVAAQSQSSPDPTHIDAIGELLRLQIKMATQPWLLFLTTRVGSKYINTRNLNALVNSIRVNTLHHTEFRGRIELMMRAKGEELSHKLQSVRTLPAKEFKDIFCVGFGKWLLSFLQTARPRVEFINLESYYYSVVPGKPDMVSLGYLCRPRVTLPKDPFHLIKDAAQEHSLSEIEMAMTLLEVTQAMKNVDELLQANTALNDSMIKETEDLLRLASYAVDDSENGYRAWLQRGAPHQ